MDIDLTQATLAQFTELVFARPLSASGSPWYFDDVSFRVEPTNQLRLLSQLLHGLPSTLSRFSDPEIEQGLWCMLGGSHSDAFLDLIWEPELPFASRAAVIEGIPRLYDLVLARPPYEEIDFEHPDATGRRYRTIDYMAPDLLLNGDQFKSDQDASVAPLREVFFNVFSSLLNRDAPVAQYAALHGLGHLRYPRRTEVIETYLAGKPTLNPAHRAYAESARRGDLL